MFGFIIYYGNFTMNQIFFILLSLFVVNASAQQVITVVNAQGPTQSMTPQIMRVIDEANRIQNKYRFVQEFKPGGFESIGVKFMLERPQDRVVTVTNSVVEAESRGFVDLNNLRPVFSHGDACWAIISNTDLNKTKEITVGGPAIGGAAHLAALQIGKKYNVPVRYIVYRSNYDALVNMAADDHSVNLVMDRLVNAKQFAEKNQRIRPVALNCPDRDPAYPNVKTLKELQINSPYIWQFTMASPDMPVARQQEIADIFRQVYLSVGRKEMQSLSDFVSPVYLKEDTATHYNNSISTLRAYRQRYAKEIANPN